MRHKNFQSYTVGVRASERGKALLSSHVSSLKHSLWLSKEIQNNV